MNFCTLCCIISMNVPREAAWCIQKGKIMLSIQDINKSYRSQTILNNISFNARPGECIGLLGPNGCGKSTLLQIIAGSLRPDSGKVLLNGENLLANRRLQTSLTGYVPQSNPLYPDMTVRDHLKLWYSAANRSYKEDFDDGFLSMLGLGPLLDKKVRNLSGGMQKRLSIGCALAARPPLLLLDEPDAALDLVCRRDIRNYIKYYCSEGNTVLLVTHDTADFRICDRLLLFCRSALAELPGSASEEQILDYLE